MTDVEFQPLARRTYVAEAIRTIKDMILEGRDTVPGRYFSIFVGSKHVVALSGLQGRQTFFDNKQLNLAQG